MGAVGAVGAAEALLSLALAAAAPVIHRLLMNQNVASLIMKEKAEQTTLLFQMSHTIPNRGD